MPTTDELQQQIEALTQRVDAITAPPTDYYVHQYSGEEIDDAVAKISGSTGLVSSFNGRTGAVMPAAGDYTAAMVGAAPSGYGLGEDAAAQPSNIDEITDTGWYLAFPDSMGGTFPTKDGTTTVGNSFLFHMAYNANFAFQIMYLLAGASGGEFSNCRLTRRKDSGVWGDWYWINPPLSMGVEYKTYRKVNGQTVYTKLINCGNLPNNTTVNVQYTADTTAKPVSVQAQIGSFAYAGGWSMTLPTNTYMAWGGMNAITLQSSIAVSGSYPVTAVVEYVTATN